jgi:hypothetical protein
MDQELWLHDPGLDFIEDRVVVVVVVVDCIIIVVINATPLNISLIRMLSFYIACFPFIGK